MSSLREKLASVYEQEEEYVEAAKILQGIPLDSGHRYVCINKMIGSPHG
jgi:COP9 signalosome complex subunit 4